MSFDMGDLAILDETKIPVDVKGIPVWNLIHHGVTDYREPSYVQVDFISIKDVALIIEIPRGDGTVRVLTNRGNIGMAWIGHLKTL